MKRTRYFTRPEGSGVCLWRVGKHGHVRVFGQIDKRWGASISQLRHLKQSDSIIQVSRDQARKWYPKAFRKPFNA